MINCTCNPRERGAVKEREKLTPPRMLKSSGAVHMVFSGMRSD